MNRKKIGWMLLSVLAGLILPLLAPAFADILQKISGAADGRMIVSAQSGVTVSKISDKQPGQPVALDEEITYTLTATNGGGSAVNNVTIWDTIPSGTSYVRASQEGRFDPQYEFVQWNIPNLAANNGTASVWFTVRVNNDQPVDRIIRNTARYDQGNSNPLSIVRPDTKWPTTNEVEISLADVTVRKVSNNSGQPVRGGDDILYALILTNSGSSEATNVTIRDYFPAGTFFVSASDGGTTASSTRGEFVQWNISSLVIGGTATVYFTVRVNDGLTAQTIIHNAALNDQGNSQPWDLAAPDPQTPSNQVEIRTTVSNPIGGDVNVSAAISSDLIGQTVSPGNRITYVITLNNSGNQGTTNVTVRDYIPRGTRYVEGSSGVKTWTNDAGEFIQWNIPSLAATNGTANVWFTVEVLSNARELTDRISNQAFFDQGNERPLSLTAPDPGTTTNRIENRIAGTGPGPWFPIDESEWGFPQTGFSAGKRVILPDQPDALKYIDLGYEIDIPSLNVSTKIVEIPFVGGAWDVTWLGNATGILSGSSLPGAGVSYVTGHNHLNNLEIGPFLFLRELSENDRIFVRDGSGTLLQFKVYANELFEADAFSEVRAKAVERENTLVLITCENESAEGGYLHRRVVFAELL